VWLGKVNRREASPSKTIRDNRRLLQAGRRRRVAGIEPLEPRAMLSCVAGDFNGDGVADLAIGIPSQSVGGQSNAGAVQILYGTKTHGGVETGLTTVHDQLLNRGQLGLGRSHPNDGDNFGAALAVGDFNRDGISDLAIGAPGQSVGGEGGAGTVYIVLGSHHGLRPRGARGLTENSRIIPGAAAAGDHFGAALAAGHFNRGRVIDLAIGAPNKTVRGHDNAGAVDIVYGGPFRLTSGRSQAWSQNRLTAGTIAEGDLFGSTLAGGDFNGDGFGDLAVGAPGQAVSQNAAAGAVNVIYGRSRGLTAARNQFWTADSSGIDGAPTASGQFGFSLAAGDFDADGKSDLAIGAPGEEVDVAGGSPVSSAGVVHVLMGSGARLTAAQSQLWNESNLGLAGAAATGDRFGQSLSAGRINADRLSDLAVGAPGAAVSGSSGAGLVDVLYGALGSNSQPAGLAAAAAQSWDQHVLNNSGDDASAGESFGSALAIGDFNSDRLQDLAVEVPAELNSSAAGCANIVFAARDGLNAGGSGDMEQNQLWISGLNQLFPVDAVLASTNLKAGNRFLARNAKRHGVVTLPDGLEYRVITSNLSGATPTDSSTVMVNYTGSFIDGKAFDSSADHGGPATFAVSGVISGFAEALKLMHVGERLKVFIPSNLAYGSRGITPTVPPKSVLIFEIELLSIS